MTPDEIHNEVEKSVGHVLTCCPPFDPAHWDRQEVTFRNKCFVRAITHSVMHIPVDSSRVFPRVLKKIHRPGGAVCARPLVLSRDLSPWRAEHFFATDTPVPDEEMTTLSGRFLTRVFEGPYREARLWHIQMEDHARAQGHTPRTVLFHFATCPRCATLYGENHAVGFFQV